jgi:hypothetical protein
VYIYDHINSNMNTNSILKVLKQMESPHLVVVRAAHHEMLLGHVLDLISLSTKADSSTRNLPNLKKDSNNNTYYYVKNFKDETAENEHFEPQKYSTNAYVEYLDISDKKRLAGLIEQLIPLNLLPSWLGMGLKTEFNGNPHRSNDSKNTESGNDLDVNVERVLYDTKPTGMVNTSCNSKDVTKDIHRELEDPGSLGSILDGESLLKGGKPHLWLGNGRTVGKLHFDPFDNILVQLEGMTIFFT